MGCIFKSVECLPHDSFDLRNFIVFQFLEIAVSAFFRERALVLPDEQQQIVGQPVRHFDHIHDLATRFVMAAQIIDFMRQVMLDGALDAVVEKFGSSVQSKYRYRSAVSFEASTFLSGVDFHSMKTMSGPECACSVAR
jgi:hypothetical protein